MLTLLISLCDQDGVLEDVTLKRGFENAVFNYLVLLDVRLYVILTEYAQAVFNAE